MPKCSGNNSLSYKNETNLILNIKFLLPTPIIIFGTILILLTLPRPARWKTRVKDRIFHLWLNPLRHLALIVLLIILKYYPGTNIYIISFLTSSFWSSSSVELFKSLQLNCTIKIVFKSSTKNFKSSSLKHNVKSQPP